MNAERWCRMEVLFDQAMELPESERGGFLDQACAGDLELHGELKELVASAPIASVALHKAVVSEVKLLADDTVTSQLGRRIGAFRLIKLIGEGGMGAVYLAERDDAQFSQRVAIKILAHAIGTPQAVARFRDERQILAAFEHPNIVRLLDGGSTDDDLPYLVMEYIEGTTITRYADQHQLSVRARIELVRSVCAALQYAHQNLIVHCDIKPGNILVDTGGTPKVLDFGIAKLLAPVARFARQARTRTGHAVFTWEYASPEQVRGNAVSTATDVYSIGAVLYELVTGEPAHHPTSGVFQRIHAICEVDPLPPSVVGPAGRRRELAGDLDNIILKALHKEPAGRYASMEQLSDDLRRWLAGLPVAARTATMGDRARKFVRRNKGSVVATALVAAALITATVVSLRQARRADDQAALAEVERANASDAARRAGSQADRAHKAEAQTQAHLNELQEMKRMLEQMRKQLQDALAKPKQEELVTKKEKLVADHRERHVVPEPVKHQEPVLQEEVVPQPAQQRVDQERVRAEKLKADGEIADALYLEGNRELMDSRFASALAKYNEAIRHRDDPETRYKMAVSLINLDRLVEAKDNLERSLEFGGAPLGADVYRQGLAYRKRLDAQLAHVKLTCSEQGTQVLLDGKLLFGCPGAADQFLLPGDHQVVATRPGIRTVTQTFVSVAGKLTVFEF